jgi:hypothetical protein
MDVDARGHADIWSHHRAGNTILLPIRDELPFTLSHYIQNHPTCRQTVAPDSRVAPAPAIRHTSRAGGLLHRMPLAAGPIPDVAGTGGRLVSWDDRALTLSLITAWTMRTGRVLRSVRISELTAEELVNFWADDQLEPPLDALVDEWLPVRHQSREFC